MAGLEVPVEDGSAFADIAGQHVELAADRGGLVATQHADVREALDMRLARLDVMQEELAVENDVVAGGEAQDVRVDARAGLLPEHVAHAVSSSGMDVHSS